MIRGFRRTALTAAAAAALMGAVVGCSSDPPTASATPTAPPGHDAFMQCMTDNGVPAPPGGGPGGPGGPPPSGMPGGPPPSGAPVGEHGTPPAPPGVDQGTWDTAMQACASLMPAPPNH